LITTDIFCKEVKREKEREREKGRKQIKEVRVVTNENLQMERVDELH
jgi:hypothetical protein